MCILYRHMYIYITFNLTKNTNDFFTFTKFIGKFSMNLVLKLKRRFQAQGVLYIGNFEKNYNLTIEKSNL